MIGIYKVTNNINQHTYIGQSINIEQRWKNHLNRAFCETGKEYNKTLYRAMRKYGVDNFSFEIIEECLIEQLNEKEIYWIAFYNSFSDGYNETIGGEGYRGKGCEDHPKTKLTNDDVYYIRECYNQHQNKNAVFEQFADRIGLSGFSKIWNGYSWKLIHYDVYTEDNKRYYLFIRNSHSENNGRARLSLDDVKNIRQRRKHGEDKTTVYNDYQTISYGSFQNVWYYQNWKQVIV